MTIGRRTVRALVVLMVAASAASVRPCVAQTAPHPDSPSAIELPSFRLFLHDGTALVSDGEPTRVGDRVVFSMPTSSDPANPGRQLVNLSASHVDWDRTFTYAESVRAARYVATHAEENYRALSAEIGQAINDLTLTSAPAERLRIIERARQTLAEWPARHFNYRIADIRRMLAILDEAIADLRVAAGVDRFDLTFVATVAPPSHPALLPKPGSRDAIEQTIAAARLSDTSVERVSLMAAALTSVERGASELPSAWRRETRATLRNAINAELKTDRQYQSLAARVRERASERAASADVRGVERLLTDIEREDADLGGKRPDVVTLLVSSVKDDLEAARRLRLARDRWAIRLPELRRYHAALSVPVSRLDAIEDELEDIKALAGSSPSALAVIQQSVLQAQSIVALLAPPEEFLAIHALVTGAVNMADRAVRLRREATLSGDLTRAWDASSAAAGALLLVTRAESELRAILTEPRLPQ